ncbi:MAG: hypothetical protein J0M21_00035 [Xanthomonadales bacterium]|nr:hypothetical protein [Xanthomonadales bacterium]
MEWIQDHIPAWNGLLALFLFWLPLLLCLYGYTVRSVREFANDRAARANAELPTSQSNGYYQPSITVGTLLARLAASVVPIVNLVAAIFDVAPEVFGQFFNWASKALDIPLVPTRAKRWE